MVNDIISLTPDLLLGQAQEMKNLQQRYVQLFQQMDNDLREINGSWSEYLANSFEGKIRSAQQGFQNIGQMLANGAAAANIGVERMVSKDTSLGNALDSGLREVFRSNPLSSAATLGALDLGDFWEQKKQDYKDVMEGVAAFDDVVNENLTDEQKKWLSDAMKYLGLTDVKDAYKFVTELSHGNYGEASQMLGKLGMDMFFNARCGRLFGGIISDGAFKLIDGAAVTATKATLYAREYYAENGLVDGFKEAFSNVMDYNSEYYAEHGGLLQGVVDGGKDIINYLGEQLGSKIGWRSASR